MDSRILVEKDISLGSRATDALSSDVDLRLQASFWWLSDDGDRRLLLATPFYDKMGPYKTYLKIRKTIDRAGLLDELPLSRVLAISPSHSLVSDLRKLLGGSAKHIGIENVQIGSFHIAGAYIYFLLKAKAGPKKKKSKAGARKKT